jgi:hypothetical protein
MRINNGDKVMNNTLTEAFETMMNGYENFKRIVKEKDPSLYERWTSGGHMVSSDFISMYPCAEEVYNQLIDDEDEDIEDDEEEDEDEDENEEKTYQYYDTTLDSEKTI